MPIAHPVVTPLRSPSREDLQQRIALLEDELAARLKEAEIADYQMMRAYDYIMSLYNVVPSLLITSDDSGCIRRANLEAAELLGRSEDSLRGTALQDILPEYETLVAPLLDDAGRRRGRHETEIISADGTRIPILLSLGKQQVDVGSDHTTLVLSGTDLRERRRLEVELRHAQKLEAIGQLAAGIAHEINTPMQFINDNLNFIGDGVNSLLRMVDAIERRCHRSDAGDALLAGIRDDQAEADCDFLRQRLPRAITRALEGVGRVSRIIDGMRLFSHPGLSSEPIDLDSLIESALTIARNEYKYVADVELHAGALPPVHCVRGDIGQVVINLLTNAAHAIAERLGDSQQRGLITITTRFDSEAGEAEISVEDNGSGIPDAVRARIYDPFFTTKAVGKGTGQGLAISRSIIVERHGGSIRCEPVSPHGTRFIIRLPLQPLHG